MAEMEIIYDGRSEDTEKLVTDRYLLTQALALNYAPEKLDDFARRWREKLRTARTEERKKECLAGIDNCERAAKLLRQQQGA